MADKVIMATYQGVRDAKEVKHREYREVPGADLSIARGGKIPLGDQYLDADDWPFLVIPAEDGLYRAHVPAAVALAWTSPEDRENVRNVLPADAVHTSDGVMELVETLNISKHAVAHIARTPEDDLRAVEEAPLRSWADKDVRRLENVTVDDYKANLSEHTRPPSKGGNASALHVHSFTVDGQRYSFFGRGKNRRIFKRDTASFDYVVTEEGYRNVLQHTIRTRDEKGKIMARGDRSWKPTLRSRPTRFPGSRREARG